MARSRRLRIVSYNVHRCTGCDRVHSPRRIAEVIARLDADIVALQELDVAHARTGHADQPQILAGLLNMDCFFHPAMEAAHEHYGDAILSRLPMRLVQAKPLPTPPHGLHWERRAAMWVTIEWRGREVQVLNTHLGVSRRERQAQVEALLGPDWLGHPACKAPRILCGDLNAWPGSGVYQRLRQVLANAQDRRQVAWWKNTFPSRLPLLCLDHVFHSSDLVPTAIHVPRTRLTRVASDHLPLVVELALP